MITLSLTKRNRIQYGRRKGQSLTIKHGSSSSFAFHSSETPATPVNIMEKSLYLSLSVFRFGHSLGFSIASMYTLCRMVDGCITSESHTIMLIGIHNPNTRMRNRWLIKSTIRQRQQLIPFGGANQRLAYR